MMNISHIEYANASFSMCCLRKHLVKDITYFLYLIEDSLILTQELESQQPKYHLPITLETKVYWSHEKQYLTQFGIEYKGDIKYFDGKSEELKQLKRRLKNRVMFRDVNDFYLPLKQLGKGGSSRVYLVVEKYDKKDFASKNVEKRYLKEDGGYEALFNEINLMANLDNEFIVKLEEVYEGETTFYIILEYLKGSSLHEIITKNGISSLNWEEIRSIMWSILQGVAHMHSLNIMHRDLKPENIMFKDANDLSSLRIVDFGLATRTTAQTYPFPKCGTPGYVAPEIANLKDLTYKYDKICDIFSVGCIFYKLITAKDLFPGNDYHDILKLNKKCNVDLEALQIYKTPQVAIDLIRLMLQVNPNQRITAQDALEHPFFTGTFAERKSKFQQQKKQLNGIKPWQTTAFKTEKSDRIQLPEIKQKSRQRDDEEVEDERAKIIRVPAINSPRLASHAKRKNLALVDGSPTDILKSQFKKFSTQDFDPTTSDTQSPDSARLNFSNSPRLVSINPKKKFTYSKFNQQQAAIYEVEDEQKH